MPEVWDPSVGMVVIMNVGALLRMTWVLSDEDIDTGLPSIKRAVSFEFGGIPHYAGFDRIWDETSAEHLPAQPGTDAP
ncbi:MAG: hypothetical protein ABI759_32595 [Candidatus Solibacter sp.]